MKFLSAYQELHVQKKFKGYAILPYVKDVTRMIEDYNAKTLLDYGCGLGRQYRKKRIHEIWNIMPVLYDPANPNFAEKPKQTFDGVICTDVLEHIPEEELATSLEEIFTYADAFVFFSVSLTPSKKTHPKVGNLHVTLKSKTEWTNYIAKFATVPFRLEVH
jgi:Methyltransferase domain